jgi:hypothetical protein
VSNYRAKLLRLVNQLSRKTLSGEIKWYSDSTGYAAITNLTAGHVEIKRDRDESGQDAIRISIFDQNGDLKTSFDDTAIEEHEQQFSERRSYFLEMQELLESALRSAKGEDAILDAILDELEDNDVPF